MKMRLKPLSIYLHIPFCERRCDYCDFVSFDDCHSQIPAYIDALCNEIRNYGGKCKDREVKTIFFGGGTPSLLSVKLITRIFATLRNSFIVSDKAEITIETNPNSISIEKLKTYLSLGINRISIGVQSLNPITLGTLGRVHSPRKAMTAIKMAHDAGFENINIDIIFNVPISRNMADSGLRRNLEGEISHLLDTNPWITHISAYSLMVAAETKIAQRLDYEELYELNDDKCIGEELELHDVLKQNGFNRYEVSNWAKRGYKCKHNLNYWTAQSEYLGLGLGASGLFNGERYDNTDDMGMYLLRPDKVELREKRSLHSKINETILLGLRMQSGVSLKHLANFGVNIIRVKSQEILELVDMKLLRVTKDAIKPTKDGVFVLNAIIERLLFDEIEVNTCNPS